MVSSSVAFPSVRRAGRVGSDDSPGAALDGPASVKVSCLLMEEPVESGAVSVGSGKGKVALFANPYLDYKEEALAVDAAGGLTYLRRAAASETGWVQEDVLGADGRQVAATEVTVVVHPKDRTLWAVCAGGPTDLPRALRFVPTTTAEGVTTGWKWLEDRKAIDFGGGSGVSGVRHLYTYYDGRIPLITCVDATSGELVTIRVSEFEAHRFAAWNSGNRVTRAGALVDLAGGYAAVPTPPMAGWIAYALVGRKLTRYPSMSPVSPPIAIASDVAALVGVFRPYGEPELGCLYLDGSGNLVTWHPDGSPDGKYTYTSGLGLAMATSWIDADGMVHVYGLTSGSDGSSANTLKVLHQTNWRPGGAPGWSLSTAKSVTDPARTTVVPAWVGLVQGVVSFVLDPYPDLTPSQFVKLEGVAASGRFSIHTQDTTSLRWSRDKVRLSPSGEVDPDLASHYVSSVTVLDGRGLPLSNLPVKVSAETLVEIQVDGASYLVGPGHGAALSTDHLGRITIATAADSLLPATLHVDAVGLESGAVVQPASAIHEYLAGTGTIPSQKGTFDYKALQDAKVDGVPIVDPAKHDEEAVKGVVHGMGQVFTQASGTQMTSRLYQGTGHAPRIHGFAVGRVSGARSADGTRGVGYAEFTTPEQMQAHLAEIRALPEYGGVWADFLDWAGDVWEGIKNGAIEVYHVAVQAVTSVFVYIGDKIVELVGFVVDTVESAVRAVEAIVRQVVETVAKVVDWLKALFNIQDILDTKAALESGMSTLMSYGAATVRHYGKVPKGWFAAKEAEVKEFFEDAKERYAGRPLGDAANQVPAIRDASGGTTDPQSLRENPQATWMLDRVMGPRTMTAAPRSLITVEQESPIIDAFKKFAESLKGLDLGDEIVEVLGDLGAIVASIVDPSDPEQAKKASVTALLTDMEKLTRTVLDALDHIVEALLELAATVADNLQDVLNTPLVGMERIKRLHRWMQRRNGAQTIEDLTPGGLICLVAAFAVTTCYKLINGVDNPPFPGGKFPAVPAPPWHPDHDPKADFDDPAYNARMRDVQQGLAACGLFGAFFEVGVDLIPLATYDEEKPPAWNVGAVSEFLAFGSALLTGVAFGSAGSCPPISGSPWQGGEDGGAWTAAFVISTVTAAANLGTIFVHAAGELLPEDLRPDTPILRNLYKVVAGPGFAMLGSYIYWADADAAAVATGGNPYTRAQIALAAIPGLVQGLRLNFPKMPYFFERSVVAAVLGGASQAVTSSMMLAGAVRSPGPMIVYPQPNLLPGKAGTPYEAALVAEGGDEIFNAPLQNWQVRSGALPPGLSLDPDTGVISGIPTRPGSFNFQVTCSNSFGPPQYSAPMGLVLTINP